MRTLLLALLGVHTALAVNGIDSAANISLATWKCLKQHNIDFMFTRAYHSYGAIDANAIGQLEHARVAGIHERDVYMFPCFGKRTTIPAAKQVGDMVQMLKHANSSFGLSWFDIEDNPSTNCGWGANLATNCAWMTELIQAANHLNLKIGIYSSHYMWSRIMGLDCHVASHLPLWYAHYDNQQSFSDYVPFGGWAKPAIKQYGAAVIPACGIKEDGDWKP